MNPWICSSSVFFSFSSFDDDRAVQVIGSDCNHESDGDGYDCGDKACADDDVGGDHNDDADRNDDDYDGDDVLRLERSLTLSLSWIWSMKVILI